MAGRAGLGVGAASAVFAEAFRQNNMTDSNATMTKAKTQSNFAPCVIRPDYGFRPVNVPACERARSTSLRAGDV